MVDGSRSHSGFTPVHCKISLKRNFKVVYSIQSYTSVLRVLRAEMVESFQNSLYHCAVFQMFQYPVLHFVFAVTGQHPWTSVTTRLLRSGCSIINYSCWATAQSSSFLYQPLPGCPLGPPCIIQNPTSNSANLCNTFINLQKCQLKLNYKFIF